MLARSDEALFRCLLDGDLAAFDELYGRYERHLFGFIRAHLAPAEAEEVLQETFVAVLREREAGRAARSFRAWLFQVARNLCLNRLRTQSRAARALDRVAADPVVEPAPPPERALEREQLVRALRAAVDRLPPALGELYRLRAGGLSYDELAAALGVPLGTVKSRLHELVTRLREEMPR